MSDLPLIEWDHSLFEDLQQLLARVVSRPTTSLLRRLHARLDEARPWLLALTQLPGPSEEDRENVEKDPIALPSGASVRITDQLLHTTTNISNLLSLSPIFSAILALQAESMRSRYPSRSIPEIATYILHDWTTKLLDFLHELLRLSIGTNAESGAPFDALRDWVSELLVTKSSLGRGKGEGTLVDQILSQLGEIHSKLDILVRSPRTSGPDFELLTFRVGAVRAEQGKLVGMLGVIAQGGFLGRGHVIKVLKWLKKSDRVDATVGSVLACFLAIARPIDMLRTSDTQFEVADEWCRDTNFLKLVSKLAFVEDWTVSRLRETAKLAWSLFILSALRHDTAVSQLEIDVTAAEHYLADAVNGDAFQSLRDLVETNRKALSLEDDDAGNGREQDMLVKLANRSDPASQDFVLGQLEDLVSAIAAKKHFLRNLRNREEDVAVRRSQSAPPPANYQAFLSLVATVYRSLPPDSAQYLWDNSTFTSAILDSRGGSPSPALWDMLSAISSGPTAASKAYERIKDTRFSWNLLFKFYQHYLDIMPRLFEPIKTTRRVSMDPMSSNEIEMCRGWTNVLATVVRSSPLARSALLQAKPHPLQMLFEYVNCDIPLDLKAIIFGAITAFCTRISDAADDDVLSKAVEIYERISFADAGVDTRHLDASRAPPPTGWMAKMEYAEQDVNTYPLTRAYIQFLTGLLPVTTSASGTPLAPRIRLTIALHRGTSYVLDRVLLVSNSRRYAREGERWEMFACIVTFLERALLGFHMDELLSQANSRAIGQIASSLAEEAGFTILLRLLSERPIFTFLAGIVDQASAAPSPRPPLINDVLLRSLRVYHRVLDIQLIFSDVLLLTLSDPTRNVAIVFRQPLGLQSLDQYLLVHLSNVNAIALLVGDDDFSISLVSTKVMSALAASPIFSRSDVFRGEYSTSVNRLAGIIDASDDSLRIAQGFCNRLDGGGNDLGPDRLTAVESAVLSGDIKASDIEALPLVVRSAILDLLIDSTLRDVPGPNIAHFLLGFEFKGNDFGLQDPQSTDSRLSCLQVVLDQLSQGAGGHEYSTVKLVSSHPVLAAKTARLIYQLFSHPFTGQSAMSYAISVAGFSARQLASLPRQCPAMNEDTSTGLGIASHYDIDIATSADILVAFLDYQRWILSSSALETFAFDGHGASASQVTASLFQASTEDADVGEDDSLGQRPPLIVDLLSSIDVEWQEEALDDMTASRPLDFYGNFDFDKYKRADAEWWDLDALGRGLRAFRRQLERQGAISAVVSAKAIDIEAEYIIKRLGATNRATDISLAKGSFLTAWNQALKVSLAMLFQHVSEDQQEVVLFELLDALLDRFDGDQPPGVLEIICESVLVAITSLVNVLMEFDGVYLPVERLTITLRKIIDAIVRPGTTENARGTLYAATTQYIQLLAVSSSRPDDASFIASTIGRESVIQSATPGLHRATIKAIEAKKDRFMLALCRDAMDDRDVWKTECFTLLSGIAAICQSERDRQILSPLTKDGFLPAFVRSIKDREIALQECLSPDSPQLHAYWVYEAKIAFLLSVAASRRGAEELLDAGVFEVFSTCGFISVQPMAAEPMDEFASAEVVQRQHRVLICALQLIARTLASLRKSPRSGAGHAISFFNAHRQSILLLLRENQQIVTLTGVEECRLIISILALVIHKVPAADLRSPSGFGAFHLAVLSVAARFFDREAWTDNLLNQEEAVVSEPKVLGLSQVIMSYLCATTAGLKAGSGYPVFVAGVQRSNGGATKYIPSAPSIQMAADLLSDLTERVQETSAQYETLFDRLHDGGELDEADLQIWRHLLFYANDARGALDPVKPDNLSVSLGAFSSSQLDGSRSGTGTQALERIARSLRGILERLEETDMHPDLRRKGLNGEKGDAYHRMLIRRLKELTGSLGASMDED